MYKIRDYTFNFLRALAPFYETICISKMPHFEIEQIINHMEEILNMPLKMQNMKFLDQFKCKNKYMRGNDNYNEI